MELAQYSIRSWGGRGKGRIFFQIHKFSECTLGVVHVQACLDDKTNGVGKKKVVDF